jgi:hypothetical protein
MIHCEQLRSADLERNFVAEPIDTENKDECDQHGEEERLLTQRARSIIEEGSRNTEKNKKLDEVDEHADSAGVENARPVKATVEIYKKISDKASSSLENLK